MGGEPGAGDFQEEVSGFGAAEGWVGAVRFAFAGYDLLYAPYGLLRLSREAPSRERGRWDRS